MSTLALLSMEAASITSDQALEVAQAFMGQHQARYMPSAGAMSLDLVSEAKAATGVTDYYVFNRGTNGGYVVVSGDDRTIPVLGYSTTGTFDTSNVPENMRWWLGEYQRQIEWLRNHPEASPRQDLQLSSTVEPLLATQWNQSPPYNLYCPEVYGTSSGRAWTGCVATATAQIMKYYEWPAQGRASHSYYWVNEDGEPVELSADFSQSHYQWSDMANGYAYDSDWNFYVLNDEGYFLATQEQQDAVAQLMSDVGIAMNMKYGSSGSGTGSYNVMNALLTYFDYDESMQYYLRDDYTEGDWDAMLRSELDEARPIYYSGSNTNAGHAFVFDGYDSRGYFHINWGWGGTSDGYFASTVLNPRDQGAGSSEGGYNMGQTAIVSIKPATEPSANLSLVRDLEPYAEVMPANDVRAKVELEAVGADLENCYVLMWVLTPEYRVLGYEYKPISLKAGEKKVFTYNFSVEANEGDICYLALHNPYYNYGYIWGGVSSFVIGDWETPPYEVGDVTGDEKVDVSDVNAAINIILEHMTRDDYPGNADLTGDDKVDISDVNAIINIILEN